MSEVTILKKHLRGLLIRLTGVAITGVGLTAIGQPTAKHVLSRFGRDFWEFLLVLHLLFLLFLTVNAVAILRIALQRSLSTRRQAMLGIGVIAFGVLNGTLSFRQVHSSLTLFFVGLSTVLLVIIYGPMAARLFYIQKQGRS